MYRKFYLSLSLLAGLILFVFMGIAGYKEMTPEWAGYQQRYNKVMVEKASDAAMRKKAGNLKVHLQQIYLKDLKRVDRCVNCHAGSENPLMAEAKIPFRQHSGDYLKHHPPERFGCTICHNGQGRALGVREAHARGHDVHWDRPLIPFEFIQSSCALCHDPGTIKGQGGHKVASGRKLFLERGCQGCHKLDGVGGVLGKALDDVGSQPVAYFPMKRVEGEKTVYAWMKEHFDDPRNIVMGSEMLANLSDREAEFLTTYVLSLRSDEVPKKYRSFQRARGDEPSGEEGESLYKMFCVACHSTGTDSIYDEVFKRTIPAIMNPAFLSAADDNYLRTVLAEGRADTPMTAWKKDAAGLTATQIDKILAYITRNRPEKKPQPFGLAGYAGNVRHGEQLYKIRCISCHGEKGQGGVGLNLRNPVVQKAAFEFLAITIRDGRDGTHMAPFGKQGVGLQNPDIADLVAYVKTLGTKK
ncbi:MAG: c-type cytochrome [Desulfobacterales bacterium]|nr:c-type cytochrome [Desulfobacterales bacterium]